MKRLAIVLLIAAAQPLAAQTGNGAGTEAGPVMASVQPHYESVRDYIIRAAEAMPADLYAYRPAEEVRTFGELIAHLAGAQFMFCAAAIGDEVPREDQFEESLSGKADLVEALRDGFEYCDRAYEMADTEALEHASLFGSEQTRLSILVMNATHDNSHYGNLVTYMRANGLVPPSSRPSS